MKILNKFYITFTGILMGIADTLPGISGSTITYILGIYEEFIDSISNLTNKKDLKKAIIFLFKIGIGWFFGAILSILFLSKYADEHIYFISSLFLGLVVSTCFITYSGIKNEDENAIGNLVFLALGFFVTIFLFFLGWNLMEYFTGFWLYVYVFFVGIVAICSMLLPGISGSSICLIFGIYYYLIEILGNILRGEFTNISYLIVFGVGVLIGALLGSKLISSLFHKHKIAAINLILGVLIGSTIPIVYGPLTVPGGNFEAMNLGNLSYVGLIIGIVLLIILDKIRRIKEKGL